MAVKHLQNVQKQQLAIAMASDPTVLHKFKSGFNECSDEVMNYIGQIDLDTSLKQRLKTHLNKCINNVEQMAQFNIPAIAYPFLNNTTTTALFGGKNCETISTTNGDQNNNPRIQIPQGLQLIPSRLPTGEFAFLVPNSNNLQPYFTSPSTAPSVSSVPSTSKDNTNNDNVQTRQSAFEAVIPSSSANTRILSPPLSPSQSQLKSNQDDLIQRTPSPHGFRPVNPHLQKRNLFVPNNHELIQKPTAIFQNDLKTIKFPINNQDRKFSPRKIIEPLCIITNQAERFKQAHTLEDSANYEENIKQRQQQQQQQKEQHQQHSFNQQQLQIHQQHSHSHQQNQQLLNQQERGTKRKYNEGLLSLVTNQDVNQRTKIIKINDDLSPSTSYKCMNEYKDDEDDDTSQEGPSKNQYESNNDMWRPW